VTSQQPPVSGQGSQVPPWAAAPWQGGPFPDHVWAAPPARPASGDARPRWGVTAAVTAVIAAVVLGGLFADGAIAAPSAGTVTVSGPVTITAAPGWIVSESAGEITDGVALQDSTAILVAQVLSTEYRGDSRGLLADAEKDFTDGNAQITFGRPQERTLGGKEAMVVTFSALVASSGSSGVIDGELVCMVIESNGAIYAVVVQVGAPQGYLDTVSDAVEKMAASVAVAG
jgi:hypothetical protein